MSFFGFFKKPERERVIVIHAGSASVAGACVEYVHGGAPTLYYTARVALDTRVGEPSLAALERALTTLCDKLAREGGPALLRATGIAHASRITAYVAAPWEHTSIRKQTIEPGKVFTVSHATRARALAQGRVKHPNRREIDDSVIATFLNGYETHSPWGKKASRAEFVALSSSLEEGAAELIEKTVRHTLHQRVTLAAFLPAAYQSVRALYPHEEDYFIIDASGDATSVGLIEHRVLSDSRMIPHGTRELSGAALQAGIHAAEGNTHGDALALIDQNRNQRFGAALEAVRETWRTGIIDELKSFADAHALPRTLFVLADEDAREFLRSALSGSAFNALWLADEAPRVIALGPANVTGVSVRGEALGDLPLMLLALAANDSEPQEA